MSSGNRKSQLSLELSLSPNTMDEFNQIEVLEREMLNDHYLNEQPVQDITLDEEGTVKVK
jgi:hypothetical protein